MKDIPNLINDLASLRRFRNKFAHHDLMLDEEKLEMEKPGIWLRSLNRDGKLVEEFIRVEDADKKLKSTMTLRWSLLYVGLEVENRANGKEPNQHAVILELIKSGKLDYVPKQEVLAQAEPAKPMDKSLD